MSVRIEISSDKKTLIKQLEDVANQIALLIYGNKLRDCLGHPSKLLKEKLKGKEIVVRLPLGEDTVQTNRRGKDWEQRLKSFIDSMVSHAKLNGVNIWMVDWR